MLVTNTPPKHYVIVYDEWRPPERPRDAIRRPRDNGGHGRIPGIPRPIVSIGGYKTRARNYEHRRSRARMCGRTSYLKPLLHPGTLLTMEGTVPCYCNTGNSEANPVIAFVSRIGTLLDERGHGPERFRTLLRTGG